MKQFAGALAVVLTASSCAPHVPFALSKDDQTRFGGSVLRVSVAHGDPMIFGLDNCVLYTAQTAHEDIVGWMVVLASDWGVTSYPKWMTVCTSQRVKYDGKYVIADLCAQAIGAGGGCAGGGTFRSRTGDARNWQIQSGSGWVALPKPGR